MEKYFKFVGLLILALCFGNIALLKAEVPQSEECRPGQWKCRGTAKCISEYWKCDGEPDCADASDEDNCGQKICPENEMNCDGRCMPIKWRCDGENDCASGEDEANCTEYLQNNQCQEGEWKCTERAQCISESWKCDDNVDCGDSTDEENCASHTCKPDMFQCKYGLNCISKRWLCDGDFDCQDQSDEDSCSNCLPTEFQCKDTTRCINMYWVCDGEADCQDSSDEKQNCSERYSPKIPVCLSSEFECRTSVQCIDKSLLCDGDTDCADGSDETDVCHDLCLSHTCPRNTHCVIEQSENETLVANCVCNKGFSLGDEGYGKSGLCKDIDECEEHVCSQICINTEGNYKCNCFEGYTFMQDPVMTVYCLDESKPSLTTFASETDSGFTETTTVSSSQERITSESESTVSTDDDFSPRLDGSKPIARATGSESDELVSGESSKATSLLEINCLYYIFFAFYLLSVQYVVVY